MAKEAWLINPKRKRRRTKTKRRRRNPLTQPRRIASSPASRRLIRRAPVSVNRRRRRTSSRKRVSYRRNPPGIQSIFNQLMPVTTGFIATKFVGNMVSPMLGQLVPGNGGPFMRILTKVGIAWLTAWGAEQFVGKRFFMPVMIGGSLEAIQDFTREFVSPMFPALAAYEYPLSGYYEPTAGGPTGELPCPEGAVEAANNGNSVGAYHDQGYRVMT